MSEKFLTISIISIKYANEVEKTGCSVTVRGGKIFLCTELIITFYEMSKDLCSGDCLSLESGYNTNMLHFVHNLGFRVLVLELVQ